MTKFSLRMLLIVLCVTPILSFGESLYDEQSYKALASDYRARHPGDVVTVMVFENSSATSSANTDTTRDTGIGFELSDSRHIGRAAGIKLKDNFEGDGKVQRSGRLLAQLTVVVEQVLGNGDLRVRGEQNIVLNNEKTLIRIEGRIRQQDIAENNTVLSSRLADAKITYLGEGYLAERARPGLINRVLTWLGLW